MWGCCSKLRLHRMNLRVATARFKSGVSVGLDDFARPGVVHHPGLPQIVRRQRPLLVAHGKVDRADASARGSGGSRRLRQRALLLVTHKQQKIS